MFDDYSGIFSIGLTASLVSLFFIALEVGLWAGAIYVVITGIITVSKAVLAL